MLTSHTPGVLRIQRTMRAAPEEVWALVSDITRLGEWSPETVSAVWKRGARTAAVGARFKGTNQMGPKKWRTTCTVTGCEPGRRFAFDVSIGPFSVAEWAYEFEPAKGGCVVSELWRDRRGGLVRWLSPVITGTRDRARRNEETMTVTLDRLAAYAEHH